MEEVHVIYLLKQSLESLISTKQVIWATTTDAVAHTSCECWTNMTKLRDIAEVLIGTPQEHHGRQNNECLLWLAVENNTPINTVLKKPRGWASWTHRWDSDKSYVPGCFFMLLSMGSSTISLNVLMQGNTSWKPWFKHVWIPTCSYIQIYPGWTVAINVLCCELPRWLPHGPWHMGRLPAERSTVDTLVDHRVGSYTAGLVSTQFQVNKWGFP